MTTPRTRLERRFNAEAVAQMKVSATADISVGGPGLAAQALQAGLVDALHLFVTPIIGGGTAALPDGLRRGLELLDEHRFRSGVVHLTTVWRNNLIAPIGGGRVYR